MGNPVDWDFALVITGVNPADMPLARVAEYMAVWATLLGSDAAPLYRGVVRGCAALRVRVAPLAQVDVAERLQGASNDAQMRPQMQALEKLLARDGLKRARMENRAGKVLQVVMPPAAEPALVVWDTAEIDGRVYRVSGKDESTSVALKEDVSDASFIVETNDDALARGFAAQFKGALLRVQVHGTWTRESDGRWTAKRLVADSFAVLEPTPLIETMRALRDNRGNAWSRMNPDAAAEKWRRIRDGIEAESV